VQPNEQTIKTSLLTFATIVAAAFAGPAAVFTLTTTVDSGSGSLRQAIADANSNHDSVTPAFRPLARAGSGSWRCTLCVRQDSP
jgi:hypothetical protein